ncbi:MAG: hypothetical protein AAGG68_06220, partial [Bacteroidota bacterium]
MSILSTKRTACGWEGNVFRAKIHKVSQIRHIIFLQENPSCQRYPSHYSGKSGGLLLPSPLRTVQASF